MFVYVPPAGDLPQQNGHWDPLTQKQGLAAFREQSLDLLGGTARFPGQREHFSGLEGLRRRPAMERQQKKGEETVAKIDLAP